MMYWGFLEYCFASPPSDKDMFEHTQMQFTGLVDVNKKEIYEHDIMFSPKGIHYLVVWSPTKAQFGLRYKNKWKSEKTRDIEYFFKSMSYAINHDLEIVGNLHEHPSLLPQ